MALLAQTDMAAHRHFLKQAEAYRYQTVQALNRDIKLNRKPEHTDYASDVSAITAAIRFTPHPRPFDALLPDAWVPFALLLAWVAGGAVLMRLAARHVEGSA